MNKRSRYIPIKAISIGHQVFAIQNLHPHFTYNRFRTLRAKSTPTWIGVLQPHNGADRYLVRITYRPPLAPQVHVLSPELWVNTPHRYSDSSLCLYFPKDGSWTPRHFIAHTIIPWTALWLECYELWQETSRLGKPEWFGLEAPHPRKKKRNY